VWWTARRRRGEGRRGRQATIAAEAGLDGCRPEPAPLRPRRQDARGRERCAAGQPSDLAARGGDPRRPPVALLLAACAAPPASQPAGLGPAAWPTRTAGGRSCPYGWGVCAPSCGLVPGRRRGRHPAVTGRDRSAWRAGLGGAQGYQTMPPPSTVGSHTNMSVWSDFGARAAVRPPWAVIRGLLCPGWQAARRAVPGFGSRRAGSNVRSDHPAPAGTRQRAGRGAWPPGAAVGRGAGGRPWPRLDGCPPR
jgi:hypothetical protein